MVEVRNCISAKRRKRLFEKELEAKINFAVIQSVERDKRCPEEFFAWHVL